jgi:hypothetical protein
MLLYSGTISGIQCWLVLSLGSQCQVELVLYAMRLDAADKEVYAFT